MNTTTYRARRDKGICVRCESATDGGIYCAYHHRVQSEYEERKRMRRLEDARTEPKRDPYVSDALPKMPPIPKVCPRCNGFILTQYDETRCLICAWYLQPEPQHHREPYQRMEREA